MCLAQLANHYDKRLWPKISSDTYIVVDILAAAICNVCDVFGSEHSKQCINAIYKDV